ncbi:hypothetical protein LU08_05430 [Bifidobacterium adolescentis]|jgi:hypothetical protein|nr:hypothetical protein LU08_05430 [Bifidobacterium adolescentis]
MAESWTVRQRKGFLFDEDEPRFEFLRVHVRIGAGEDTRFAVRERDLGEVVAVGEQSDGEGMAVGLRQLGPSEAESSGHAFESVDDVSFDERIKPDGVAGQFVDDVVGLVKRLAEGVGVDVARRGLVDESPHILPDAFEHGPVMFRLAGRV